MTTQEERAALRAKAKAATAGPWVVNDTNKHGDQYVALPGRGDMLAIVCAGLFTGEYPSEANGAYIAAANPETVLGLLDEIEVLEQREIDMQRGLESFAQQHRANMRKLVKLQQQHTAAMTVVGPARLALAQLDRMAHRGSGIPQSNDQRKQLRAALDALAPAEVVPS